MPQEEMVIRLSLVKTREVEEALSELEEFFAHEGGWCSVPAGLVDQLEIDLVVDETSYFSLNREEFLEALGLEPEWVLECYEV